MENSLHNINIERAVLSSVIFEPSIYEDVASRLKSSDFYLPFHRHIFETMEELEREELPIDEEFLKKKLSHKKRFDEEAFFEILSTNPLANTSVYIDEIKEKAIKRELIKLTSTIKDIVVDQDLPSMEALDQIQKDIYEISLDAVSKEFKESPQIVKSTLLHIKEIKERGNLGLVGLDTGFGELNKLTAGFGDGDLIIIAARPAMGKCLGKGTKILMYNGTLKNVEDIKVGDLLMGDDSTPRRVLSLARGKEMMYWIRQDEGIDYRVNESHILSLKRSGDEGSHHDKDILNISVKDFLQQSNEFRDNYKGYKVSVDFEEKELETDPYFLGIWLGNDKDEDIKTATKDKKIVDFLKNKRIPYQYLVNSQENRLKLLAGLIDGNGCFDKQCNGYEITQNSKQLAKEIKFLCDLLGFRTSLAKIEDHEKEVYRVRIFGDTDKIPLKTEKKKAKKWTHLKSRNQTDIKIEKDKTDEYYGFEIDGNRLFLLEDGTVTHNTAFCLNIAQKVLDRGKGVAVFSLEMPAEQLLLRMLSAKTSIPLQKLRIGDMSDNEWSRLSSAADETARQKLFVDDDGLVNIHQVRSKLRKIKARHPEISLAIIDYLQLMSSSSNKDRHLEVSEISRGLKLLAREMNMPIIALSQLNRSLESRNDKRPMLSDLRESGAIEQDADMILFVYRDDVYRIREEKEKEKKAKAEGKEYKSNFFEKPEEDAEIIIGKNRNGPIGVANLIFQKQFTRFVDKNIEIVYEEADISAKETKIEMPPL